VAKSKTEKSKVAPKKEPANSPPLRLEWRSPAELAENPKNWRRHPDAQIAALTDTLAEVGWAGACLFNERTGRLIDGHARRKVALEQGAELIPVLIGSWDDVTEAKILATLDPLGAMANADKAALDQLLAEVTTQSDPIQKMLDELAKSVPVASAPFEPNTSPTASTEPVTPADVASAQEELDGKFAGQQNLKQVTCPQCACDFLIDPENLK